MKKECIVFDCTSGADGGEAYRFYEIPSDPKLREKWVQAIPKLKVLLTTDHLVCEKHFLKSHINQYDIVKNDAGIIVGEVLAARPKLTDEAVPCVFPDFEREEKIEKPKTLMVNNDPIIDTNVHPGLHDTWLHMNHNITRAKRAWDKISKLNFFNIKGSTDNEESTVTADSDGTNSDDASDLAAPILTPSIDSQNVGNNNSPQLDMVDTPSAEHNTDQDVDDNDNCNDCVNNLTLCCICIDLIEGLFNQ